MKRILVTVIRERLAEVTEHVRDAEDYMAQASTETPGLRPLVDAVAELRGVIGQMLSLIEPLIKTENPDEPD